MHNKKNKIIGFSHTFDSEDCYCTKQVSSLNKKVWAKELLVKILRFLYIFDESGLLCGGGRQQWVQCKCTKHAHVALSANYFGWRHPLKQPKNLVSILYHRNVAKPKLLQKWYLSPNCSDPLWEKMFMLLRKNFAIPSYNNLFKQLSEKILVTECFLGLFFEVSKI